MLGLLSFDGKSQPYAGPAALFPLGAIDIGKASASRIELSAEGKAGGGARAMHPAWARHVRDQCHALGIAFLHKQWGTYCNNLWCRRMGYRRQKSSATTRRPTAKAARCSR
jgi:protein gp37